MNTPTGAPRSATGHVHFTEAIETAHTLKPAVTPETALGKGSPSSDRITVTAHLPQNEGILKQSAVTLRFYSYSALPNPTPQQEAIVIEPSVTVESLEFILDKNLKIEGFPQSKTVVLRDSTKPQGQPLATYENALLRLQIVNVEDKEKLLSAFPDLGKHFISEGREKLLKIEDALRVQTLSLDTGKSATHSKHAGFTETAIPLVGGKIFSRNKQTGDVLIFKPFVPDEWIAGKFENSGS